MTAPQPAHGGAADTYYNEQPHVQYPPQSSGNNGPTAPTYPGPKYTQQPPSYTQTYGAQPPPIPGNKPTFEQSFKLERPRWNDLWAGILLIVTFLGFAAVSGISIQGYAVTKGFNGGSIYSSANQFGLTTNTIILFAFVLAIALIISWGYFTLARAFTKQFIWITGILHVVFGLGTAIVYFARQYYSAAVVFLIITIFYLVCFISWIPRIPFSVLILQTVMDVAKNYGHVFIASFTGGLIATAFGAWFSVTLTAIYVKYEPGSNPACNQGAGGCSSATVVGLVVFVTFAAYWITEWIRQTIHTTIAGVYGSWYFCSQKPGGMPSGATRGAFRRATTYSFGSISFGSLIVSLIQLLRQGVSIAQSQQQQAGNIVGDILFCVLGCIVGLLEWAIQFINHYAFSHIALYGKAYIPAAKDTWQ